MSKPKQLDVNNDNHVAVREGEDMSVGLAVFQDEERESELENKNSEGTLTEDEARELSLIAFFFFFKGRTAFLGQPPPKMDLRKRGRSPTSRVLLFTAAKQARLHTRGGF